MRYPVVAAAFALAGCSAADGSLLESDTTGVAPGTLRLDVYPPAGDASTRLLPQSHLVEPDAYADHRIVLHGTVSWQGTLRAEQAAGWSGAVEVPTTESPLEATITARARGFGADAAGGTLLGASVRSDAESGGFILEVPAYPDIAWDVAFVPTDGAAAPFHVERAVDLTQGRAEDVLLPLGAPLYGRIVDDAAEGVSEVPLRLYGRDAEAPVEGAPFSADGTGWYVARVTAVGTYALEVQGPTYAGGPLVPTLSTEVLVEDAVDGAALSIDVGSLRETTIEGEAVGPDGRPVAGASVMLESVALEGGVGTLRRTATANEEGRFFVDVLAGVYDLTVTAPYEDVLSPVSVSAVDASEDADVGLLRLSDPVRLRGLVFDTTGVPVPDVVVTATQDGYDGFVYSSTTDATGAYDLTVPDGGYVVGFAPSDASVAGAPTTLALVAGEETAVLLEEGALLSGQVSHAGAGVAYALVEVHDAATGALVARGLTDATGGYALRVALPASE
jgi:protocatechuate 3,4-dioxygenase beta subunit